MNAVDRFLNKHTPYSFTLRGLWVLVGISFFESIFNWLPYTPIQLFFSLVILLGITAVTNSACTLITGAVSSRESNRITALILFFALSAPQSATDALLLMLAASLAILSKYLFSTRRLHVFNPAAFSLVLVAIAAPSIVSWWVGTLVLFPFVLIFGLLVVRKMENADVVWPFALAAVFVLLGETFLLGTAHGSLVSDSAQGIQESLAVLVKLVTTSPFLFVGTLMLSDPHTMPRSPYKRIRSIYGAIVGALYPLTFSWWGIVASPQLALVCGNIFAFVADAITRSRNRLSLTLQKATALSKDAFEFSMIPSVLADIHVEPPSVIDARPLSFLPGQSIEITLPHKHADYRGIRRTFVLTSAPSSHYLSFCTTIPVECSTFKEKLHASMQILLTERDTEPKKVSLSATGPFGEAFFPEDPNQKLLCIASGIGIASYMSYFRELAHNNERRDAVLFYAATSPLDFIYKDELDSYKDRIGLQVIYVPLDFIELGGGWDGPSGPLSQQIIKRHSPDYASRFWCMAGPSQNIKEYKAIAHQLHLPTEFLKAQEYPGF